MEKELKISVPKGYEIDKENSTFDCIKFKPVKQKRWRNNETNEVSGFYLGIYSNIIPYEGSNRHTDYNTFATEKQAKSALAMARISQIMTNDERFGGVVTEEEWDDDSTKYTIHRWGHEIKASGYSSIYTFLAFHEEEQRDLFMQENMDLLKDYFMLD